MTPASPCLAILAPEQMRMLQKLTIKHLAGQAHFYCVALSFHSRQISIFVLNFNWIFIYLTLDNPLAQSCF